MNTSITCIIVMLLSSVLHAPNIKYNNFNYCRPMYSEGCAYGDGIRSYVFNSITLSSNSGCSEGGYGVFSTLSPSVSPGKTYTFSVKFIANYLPTGVSIWADFNRNNSFESSERVYNGEDLFDEFSGTITIPLSTMPGLLNLRVGTASYTAPNDPCGTYDYGETEDYQLQVVSLDQEISSIQDGFWNQPSIWSCNCIPASTDVVYVKHIVQIPINYIASVTKIKLSTNAKLNFSNGAKIRYK